MADTSSATLPDSVLLVDDEPSVLGVLSMALKRGKLKVRTATTGEEAIAALDEERFGAVVTDKNLPKASGLDVIRAARAKQPYIACVVITGYVSTASVLEAMELGANDYLLKPFDDVMLVVTRVKKAIEAQRTEAERATLAEMIKELARDLRKSEGQVAASRTELDLFQSVMELRSEDSSKELLTRIASLEADVGAEKNRRGQLKDRLGELAGKVREAAAGTGEAKERLEQLAKLLDDEAARLA
jgi:DNA-binding NtrC family response regulator